MSALSKPCQAPQLSQVSDATDGVHLRDWAHRDLARHPVASNIFFEPDILGPALTHLAPKDAKLITQTQNGACVAALPVSRPQGRYGPWPTPVPLAVWHHPYSMLGAPLIASDDPQSHILGLLEGLQNPGEGPKGPPVLLAQHMPMDGALWPALKTALETSGRRYQVLESTSRAGLNYDDTQELTMRKLVGKKSDQSVRASRRKLQALGTLEHYVADTTKTIAPALDVFLALEAAGWKGRAGTALASLGHDQFMRAVFAGLGPRLGPGRTRIDQTLLDGVVIASTISIASKSMMDNGAQKPLWMPWKTAFDERFADAAPGSVALYDMTAKLLEKAQHEKTGLALDSLATQTSVIANRLWRHKWQLADILIDLKPGGHPAFSAILLAERTRQKARQAAKAIQARLR